MGWVTLALFSSVGGVLLLASSRPEHAAAKFGAFVLLATAGVAFWMALSCSRATICVKPTKRKETKR